LMMLRPTMVTCADCGGRLDRAELPGKECPTCGQWPLCAVCWVFHEEGRHQPEPGDA